jgi:hypothetical protein
MYKGFDSRLDWGWWVLRIGLGVGPFSLMSLCEM